MNRLLRSALTSLFTCVALLTYAAPSALAAASLSQTLTSTSPTTVPNTGTVTMHITLHNAGPSNTNGTVSQTLSFSTNLVAISKSSEIGMTCVLGPGGSGSASC